MGRASWLLIGDIHSHVDGDSFEPSNATRMLFGRCGNKASVIREELMPRFRDSNLTLIAIEEYVTPRNLNSLVQSGDIVLLTVDNHATRKLVNDHCTALSDVCLISGGNDGFGNDSSGIPRRGTYGNVQVCRRQNGRELAPPLTHLHPEIQHPADRLPSEQSCTDLMTATRVSPVRDPPGRIAGSCHRARRYRRGTCGSRIVAW